MTEQERAELRRLHEAATPGPWEVDGVNDWIAIAHGAPDENIICQMWDRNEQDFINAANNVAFIAAARAAVPALLDEVARLRAVLVELEVYAPDWYDCDHCSLLVPRPAGNEGHAADCPVTRARALLAEDR